MSTKILRLRGAHEELYNLFKTTLRAVNFITVHEERMEGGFHIIGVNRKRASQLTATLLSLIGGFIPRKRVAVELFASEKDGELTAELRCKPYLDNLDMEAAVESPEELERCERLARLFENEILGGLRPHDGRP